MIAPNNGTLPPASPAASTMTESHFWLRTPDGHDLAALQHVGDSTHMQVYDAEGRERLAVSRSASGELAVVLFSESGAHIMEVVF